jgi:hypothetical protein
MSHCVEQGVVRADLGHADATVSLDLSVPGHVYRHQACRLGECTVASSGGGREVAVVLECREHHGRVTAGQCAGFQEDAHLHQQRPVRRWPRARER